MMVLAVRHHGNSYKVLYVDEDGASGTFWDSDKAIVDNITLMDTRATPDHGLDKAEALEMMIDDTIGALKAIREEVGAGLKLSHRSQNLGYQALDQLMAFKQHGLAALTPISSEKDGNADGVEE